MTQTVPLNESVSVVLDGSGNGTVRLGPSNAFQKWNVSMVSVVVTSAVAEPKFQCYRGRTVDQSSFLAGTYTGSNNSAGVATTVLYPSMVLTGQWLGGDAGAVATMTLSGEMEVPS